MATSISTTTSTTLTPSPSPSRLWTLHPPSTRLQTVHALLAAYSELTPSALTARLDPSFTHTVLPSSLGMPTRDLKAFTAHAGQVMQMFSRFEMVLRSVVEDVRRNEVVVCAEMIGTLAFGELSEGDRVYRNECVLFCEMSRDGTKVTGMREFVDSAKAMELRRRLTVTNVAIGKEKEEDGPEIGNALAAAGAMAAAGEAIVVEGDSDVLGVEGEKEAQTEREKLGFETVDVVLAGHWREG